MGQTRESGREMTGVFNEILGGEVKIPEKPSRIVSLSPALTETLFMLGLGDKMVGVSAFCARPEAARSKKKVGSYSSTNIELLREIGPDLILSVTGYQRELAIDLSREFPVHPLALPVSVAGIIDTVVKVGLLVGETEGARDLSSRLIREVARARADLKEVEDLP
jgi:iron complex transport system substrate-binding protein